MTRWAKLPEIFDIPEAERTPTVMLLLRICYEQQEQLQQIAVLQEQVHLQREHIQALKDEIARLKGQKPKPKIRPSQLEPDSKASAEEQASGKRPGSAKRSKNAELMIHNTVVVPPKETVPVGSRFKGHAEYTVVGLKFEPYNVKYLLEEWETPDGQRLKGQLPKAMQVLGGHVSPELVSFIVHQHHFGHVPQGLIWQQLQDIGVDISKGQVSRILTDYAAAFHEEKEAILQVGLEVSRVIHTDDTGARHNGKNGYCTHIGNEWFAYFSSSDSKSRVNFLKLLRAGHTDYVVNEDALAYMDAHDLPNKVLEQLRNLGQITLVDEAAWDALLQRCGINSKLHVRLVTEGALVGSILSHGINPEMVIVSDDAPQFNVLLHALCWIHAERTLAKLVGFNEDQRSVLEQKLKEVWELYRELKAYRDKPTLEAKAKLDARFEAIFTEKTCFATLNQALKRIHQNKAELLLVLERPDVPLHNNLSENDVREYVTRRKRNGSTRSTAGRRCRDTFASLKKTCCKLGVSFWHYLRDRFSGSDTVPQLSDLIRQRAHENTF